MTYGTKPRGDKSGAYLFLPDGEAKPMKINNPYVRVIEGKLMSYVEVHEKQFKHKVYLRSSPGTDGTGLLIGNVIANEFKLRLKFRVFLDLFCPSKNFSDLWNCAYIVNCVVK